MIELSLKEIVLYGRLDPINMGETTKELISKLGAPKYRHEDGNGTTILCYGGYEFHLFDDQFHYFQNDHVKPDYYNHGNWIEFQNDHFKIDTWFLNAEKYIYLKDVMAMLDHEGSTYTLENQQVAGEDYRVGEIKHINLPHGVSLNFEISDPLSEKNVEPGSLKREINSDFVLYAIRYEYWNKKRCYS